MSRLQEPLGPQGTPGSSPLQDHDDSLKSRNSWEPKVRTSSSCPSKNKEVQSQVHCCLLGAGFRALLFANLYCPLVVFIFWTDCILTGLLAEIRPGLLVWPHRGEVPLDAAKWHKRAASYTFPALPL